MSTPYGPDPPPLAGATGPQVGVQGSKQGIKVARIFLIRGELKRCCLLESSSVYLQAKVLQPQ
jgi:hypothetical protein